MNRIFLIVAASCFLLLSCHTTKNTVTTAPQKTEEEASAPPTPVYHPSETKINDLVHTKLEVKFDWEKQQLNGKATITLHPHFYPTDSLTLDAKGMDIHEVD